MSRALEYMSYIIANPGCTCTDIAHAYGVSLTTVSSEVKRLVTTGLVEKRDRYGTRKYNLEAIATLEVAEAHLCQKKKLATEFDARAMVSSALAKQTELERVWR